MNVTVLAVLLEIPAVSILQLPVLKCGQLTAKKICNTVIKISYTEYGIQAGTAQALLPRTQAEGQGTLGSIPGESMRFGSS